MKHLALKHWKMFAKNISVCPKNIMVRSTAHFRVVLIPRRELGTFAELHSHPVILCVALCVSDSEWSMELRGVFGKVPPGPSDVDSELCKHLPVEKLSLRSA